MALNPEEKITRARANLIMQQPFFGTLALRMEAVPEPGLKGMRTDGTKLRYDPEHIDNMTSEQVTGLVAATVLHPAFMHHTRRGERDKNKWNSACDHAVSHILADAGFALPDSIKANPQFANMNAEHIYTLLPDDPRDQKGKGQGQGQGQGKGQGQGQGQAYGDGSDGGGVDDSPNGSSAAELEAEEREWKQTVAQAAHAAKQAGKLPAGMERYIDELMAPTVDWKSTLIRFMTEKAPDDFSWQKPNRRFIANGLYLPSMNTTATGEVVVCVDTSGSIGAKELSEFGGEIQAICTDLKPRKVYVIYCDAAVNKVVEFGPYDEVVLEAVGGGGTDFRPPFKWLEDNGINPKCLVYLTDGYGPFPEEDKVWFPTLWAINNMDVVPPFGEHLTIQV